jgi:threonine synthase
MTQRKLTEGELTDAREAYLRIGRLYNATNSNWELVRACCLLCSMIQNGTSDGKPPIQAERVPTAADIGRPVKWKLLESDTGWTTGYVFCGWTLEGRSVVQYGTFLHAAEVCIIDQESGK